MTTIIPKVQYCIEIVNKLNSVNNYPIQVLEKFIEENKGSEELSLIDIHPIFEKQIKKGWEESNKLVNSPFTKHYKLLYKAERILSRLTKENKKHGKNIDNIWLYIYCYFLRLGYNVNEEKGVCYHVTEPLGHKYRINHFNQCNCFLGEADKPCLHLQLVEWYRQTKFKKLICRI